MPKVWVFFYGSYLNLKVLAEVDLHPEEVLVASLTGFRLVIAPRANLDRCEDSRVYGILTRASHAELERLYAHARDVLGQIYLPEAVLVRTLFGEFRPALTYICPEMKPERAEPDYVHRILDPAREYGFPASYLREIESWLTWSPEQRVPQGASQVWKRR